MVNFQSLFGFPPWQQQPWRTPGINPGAAVQAGMQPQQQMAPKSMGGPAWLQKLTGGVNRAVNGLGGAQQGEAITPEQRMAVVSSLLQGSGPVPAGTRGLLQPFGDAMQASAQAKSAAQDQELRRKVLEAQLARAQQAPEMFGNVNPSDFTPESMAKFAQTQNYGDLVPVERNSFNRVNPRDYTPESLAKYEQSGNLGDLVRVAPYQAVNTPGGGVNRFDPITGRVLPTNYTPAQGTREAAERKGAEAQAAAVGDATGKALGAYMAKASTAQGINEILDIADPLIDVATGSGTGAARDKVAAFFGVSTEGAQGIAQLAPLQAALMMSMPRMEGPQSDKDVQLYRDAAGQIGNPEVPAETKRAAMKTIRALQQKYAAHDYVPGVTPINPGSANGAAPQQPGTVNWSDL